jgi:hypothetical protein
VIQRSLWLLILASNLPSRLAFCPAEMMRFSGANFDDPFFSVCLNRHLSFPCFNFVIVGSEFHPANLVLLDRRVRVFGSRED